MLKFFYGLTFVVLFLFSAVFSPVHAGSSFVTLVNPVRGEEFWDSVGKPEDTLQKQIEIIQEFKLPITWLVRYDALVNPSIINKLNYQGNSEKGLFLEVIPSWTKDAQVNYRPSESWHHAGSIFLTGYTQEERQKLIDQAFNKFKDTWGFYPKSVGAWWVDSYSLDYMQEKYGITAVLIVADQYTTDNYQIWGQYFGYPYYPDSKNTLYPAQNVENKLDVVVMQWAARDPLRGYGEGVQESTYSLQANDYLDFHKLDTTYFSKLVDLYTTQKENQVNQIVVGIENSYSQDKYLNEFRNQMSVLSQKEKQQQLQITSMSDFASWYQTNFPQISPDQIIVADDLLGLSQKVVWYMNPYYRVGWFYTSEGSIIRDVRQYIAANTEPCFSSPCQKLNFATFATRVLDDVTYKKNRVIDQGKIANFSVKKESGSVIIKYQNEAGRTRTVEFLPRDIVIDQKPSSIDGFIMNTMLNSQNSSLFKVVSYPLLYAKFAPSWMVFSFQFLKFLFFTVLGLFLPGYLIIRKLKVQGLLEQTFLSIGVSMVILTWLGLISGILQINWLVTFYLSLIIFYLIYRLIKVNRQLFNEGVLNLLRANFPLNLSTFNIGLILLVVGGTVFQSLALWKSGWVYPQGIGFWGPLGHDGIWHQSLINQLILKTPPENPGFAGVMLSNYHYYYDLLVALSARLTGISVVDLLYRFYPLLFSVLFGIGTIVLSTKLFKNKIAVLTSVYFAYFAGSFGWIVEYLRTKQLGGESAFWVNQPVSFNLNPPFAISLILVIVVFLLFHLYQEKKSYLTLSLLVLVIGSLVEFKVYAGVVVLGGLFIIGVWHLLRKREWQTLGLFALASSFSAIIFFPQNQGSSDLLVLKPFWFIHSMIDSPDRVGWQVLSQARDAYFQRGEIGKYFLTESLSLGLFILGNLGVRFLGFAGIIPIIKNKAQTTSLFILGVGVVSLIIPLLFIQKGNPWNTIQFAYYALFSLSLFTGWMVSGLLTRLYSGSLLIRGVRILLILFVLVITPLSSIATFRSSLYPNPPTVLSLAELEALDYLRQQPGGVVLTPPYQNTKIHYSEPYPLRIYETTSYVGAYSSKAVFLEDEIQQEILQNDYKKRLVMMNDFFQNRDRQWSTNFLKENKIRYLYIPKQANVAINEEGLPLNSIFDNQEVKIYQVR